MPTKIELGPYVLGEKPAPLEYTFLDEHGAVMDLTGYTASFRCRERFADTPFTADADIPIGTDGIVVYDFTGEEFPTSGRYSGEVWVGNGTNRFMSLQISFIVAASVGSIPAL